MPKLVACLSTLALICAGGSASYAVAQVTQNVQFAKGTTSTSIRGRIKGDEFRDYVVNAREGQTMSVNLSTGNTATYFNLLPPGSRDVAIHIGSTAGNDYSGRLSQSGAYRVRVYMMRSAARRGEAADYRLTIEVAGGRPGPGPGGGGGARPVVVSDLKGISGVRAFDVMIERGFKNVDSFSSGDTLYGIYFHPGTRQCVQVTSADGRVQDARDIFTHPKCR